MNKPNIQSDKVFTQMSIKAFALDAVMVQTSSLSYFPIETESCCWITTCYVCSRTKLANYFTFIFWVCTGIRWERTCYLSTMNQMERKNCLLICLTIYPVSIRICIECKSTDFITVSLYCFSCKCSTTATSLDSTSTTKSNTTNLWVEMWKPNFWTISHL